MDNGNGPPSLILEVWNSGRETGNLFGVAQLVISTRVWGVTKKMVRGKKWSARTSFGTPKPVLACTRTGFGKVGPVFVNQKWSRVHFWHAKSGLVGPLFAGTTFGVTGP